jgi:hypothetical protein
MITYRTHPFWSLRYARKEKYMKPVEVVLRRGRDGE